MEIAQLILRQHLKHQTEGRSFPAWTSHALAFRLLTQTREIPNPTACCYRARAISIGQGKVFSAAIALGAMWCPGTAPCPLLVLQLPLLPSTFHPAALQGGSKRTPTELPALLHRPAERGGPSPEPFQALYKYPFSLFPLHLRESFQTPAKG